MGAKARKSETELEVVATARADVPLPSVPARFWNWAMPHINTFAHEGARSLGRQLGPIVKWLIVGGGVVAVAQVVAAALQN